MPTSAHQSYLYLKDCLVCECYKCVELCYECDHQRCSLISINDMMNRARLRYVNNKPLSEQQAPLRNDAVTTHGRITGESGTTALLAAGASNKAVCTDLKVNTVKPAGGKLFPLQLGSCHDFKKGSTPRGFLGHPLGVASCKLT